MLNEGHKHNNVSEQNVSGANDSSNNWDKPSSQSRVNDCGGNTLLSGSINIFTRNKFLKIFLQNIRGLSNKALNYTVIYIMISHTFYVYQNTTWLNTNYN
jgi:hypothetical protein